MACDISHSVGAGAPVPRQDVDDAQGCVRRRRAKVLQHACRTRRQENIQVPHRVQRMAMLTTITRLPMSESRALWHHSAGCDGGSSRSRFDRLYRIKALHGPAIKTSVSITIPLARILAEYLRRPAPR